MKIIITIDLEDQQVNEDVPWDCQSILSDFLMDECNLTSEIDWRRDNENL